MSRKRHRIVVNRFIWLITMALAVVVQLPAYAQTGPQTVMALDWRERNAPNGQLKAYDSTLLGDAIDLSSGRLSFEHVDVSLPGNFNLPVEIRRRLNPSQMQSGEFADWQLAIPTISTMILDDEWFASPSKKWGKIRCSGTLVSAIPNASWPTHFNNGGVIPPYNYSDGVILDVPGRVQTQVLDKTVTTSWPASAKKVTVEGWYLECLTNIDSAGTEGFVAVAPNGDRYTFNVIMNPGTKKSEFDIWQLDANYQSNGGINWVKMGVHYDILSVSKVTDVNGNWVQYNYDTSKRLQSITSSDGRNISIGRTGNQVGTVTANPGTADARQWTYTYGFKSVSTWKPPVNVNGPGGGTQTEAWGTLTAVTLPNGRQWLFDLGNLQARAVPGMNYTGTVCKQFNQTVSVTHPDGVTGTFSIEEVMLRLGAGATNNTGAFCPNTAFGNSGSSQITDVMAVTHKTLSGPGMTTATWDYSYLDTGNETIVTVHQPDDSKRIEYHPTPYAFASPRVHAKLTREELYPTMASSTPLEVRTYSYVQEPVAGSNFILNPVQDTYRPVRLSDTVITRGSDVYNTHAAFNTDRTSASYSYGFPTSVQEWSNVAVGIRQTDTVYAHNTTLWILGLPSTITKNTKLFDSFTYDSFGRLWKHYRFGDLWRTYTYGTAATALGAPYSMSDGLATPRITYFRNWKGGTPQEVERADGFKLYRTVDSNGWVTGITDWRGTTTNYSYDGIGRLTNIDLPTPWTDTSISYNYSSGALKGIQTFGTEQTTTTYDAMLRPTQVAKHSTTSGGDVIAETKYDAMGLAVFASLPSISSGSSVGIRTTYDSLGRITQTAETAIGGGTTSYEYLTGNKIRITNPLNDQLVKTVSGWGDPGDGAVVKVEKPEGVTIDYAYDIFGNLLSLNQAKNDGTQHVSSFEYNAKLQLCRRKIPETGVTLYRYNLAGEMTAFAEGQAIDAGCPSPPDDSSVVLGLDNVGRIIGVDYPGATPDITRSYDSNGNVTSVNRGGANWTYTYNTLDAVETESLSIDGRTYLVDPAYDSGGALISKRFPSGRTYDFVNDGYGRAKDVYYGTTAYLSAAIYHPNGALATLNRGNGGIYQQTLNERQLVAYVGGNWGTSQSYSYDAAGRLNGIDSPNNIYNRTFTYDGIGRLETAIGPWGSGSYSYDRLGNLTQRMEGSRTVDIQMGASNRVSAVRDSANGSNWRNYTHDARGNVTADGLHTITYDYANQPVEMTGNDAASFIYDGNLKRIKQTIDGKTIYSIYDRSGELLTRDDVTASQVTDFITIDQQTFVRVTNGVPNYPINDRLGTAYMVADQAGSITAANTYNFTPFGEGIGNDPGSENRQGYTGHIEDETGLTYMKARYYDPVIGRFLSTDPAGYDVSLNLYSYVSADPMNASDPTGATEEGVGCGNHCLARMPMPGVTVTDSPQLDMSDWALIAISTTGGIAGRNPLVRALDKATDKPVKKWARNIVRRQLKAFVRNAAAVAALEAAIRTVEKSGLKSIISELDQDELEIAGVFGMKKLMYGVAMHRAVAVEMKRMGYTYYPVGKVDFKGPGGQVELTTSNPITQGLHILRNPDVPVVTYDNSSLD